MIKVKLSDVASYSKGKQINGDELIPTGKYDYLNGGIVPSGRWTEYNTAGNTVTISEGGNSCGYVNFMQEPFWCGAHCYYLFDIKGNAKYLYYALKSQEDRLMNLRSGACMPNIKKSDLGAFTFQYEEDEETQAHVVKALELADKLINLRKRQLAKLDELVKARFVEMFQDESIVYPKKRIDLVCREIIAGGDRPKDTSDTQTEDYPYPVFANAATNEGVLCYAKTYRIESASVTVSARGSTVGYTAIREGKYTPVVRLIALVPNDELTPVYLKQYLDVNHCVVSTGSAQPQVTIPYIKGIEVVVPPLKEQDTFTKLVKQVDKQKLAIQHSLDKLETLKKSLMQEYFG